MGVRILQDKGGESCLYCSTTMWAFGPVFSEDDDPQEFLDWLDEDPRHFTDKQLESKYSGWLAGKEVEQEP